MNKTCEHCGTPFQAKRNDARYCRSTCRDRASKARRAGTVTPLATPVAPATAALTDATRAELTAHGLVDTADGILLLTLAARIDAGAETSPALASLSKEYAARKDALLPATKPTQASPMDELRALRERRRTG